MKSLFPEDINIDCPERLILTIYAGLEQFSFSIYDPEKAGSYFYGKLTDENDTDAFSAFKEIFFEQTFFSLPFRKVWIMYRTPVFTFVPNIIYKDNDKDDFMQFLFTESGGMTLNHIISCTRISVLYQMPEVVHQFMIRSFANPEFIHYSAPVIAYFLEEVKKANFRRMVVDLHEKGLDVFCFSKDTFLLGNYFPCKGLSDALYYILFTWKQLQFNQLNDYLHIAGDVAYKDELIEKLSSYLQQIRRLAVSPAIHFEGVNTDCIPFELAALSL